MKKGWKNSIIGEICAIRPPKREAREKLSGETIVSFVPMGDLAIRRKEFSSTQTRPLDKVYGGYTYFAEDDVLLAKITPCFQNGKLSIARGLVNGVGFGSSEFFVLRCGDHLDPDFLFYFLAQESFTTRGTAQMTGAVGHKRVPLEFIENHSISLPPLPEPKRIVAILDEVFAGISMAVANTEKNLASARELFESHLNAVFTQKGKGWVEKTLGDNELLRIIDGDRGTNYPKKKDFFDEGFCLFLNTKNVRPDGFNFATTMFITQEKDKVLHKGKLERRDVILTTRGTIGNIAQPFQGGTLDMF